ncbi:hypothetical protein D9M68_675410 [compost metagenome]
MAARDAPPDATAPATDAAVEAAPIAAPATAPALNDPVAEAAPLPPGIRPAMTLGREWMSSARTNATTQGTKSCSTVAPSWIFFRWLSRTDVAIPIIRVMVISLRARPATFRK